MPTHKINPQLLQRPVSVILAGAGGTGSQVLSGLARLDRGLRALGHPGGFDVEVWDPDTVSESNVGRQLFSPGDVGLSKSICLTHRVNLFFGLTWRAMQERFTTGDLSRSPVPSSPWPDVLITCVDTAAARREIHAGLARRRGAGIAYWLDCGNRQQDGQVVLGEPTGQIEQLPDGDGRYNRANIQPRQPRLPTVVDLFPALLDETIPEDDRPSCSLAEALESQDLFINQAVATAALAILWRLFREGEIDHHGCFVNLASGRTMPLAVPVAEAKAGRKKRERRAAA